jgi:hypothetical protein
MILPLANRRENSLFAALIKAHQEGQFEAEKSNAEAPGWLKTITAVGEKVGTSLQ